MRFNASLHPESFPDSTRWVFSYFPIQNREKMESRRVFGGDFAGDHAQRLQSGAQINAHEVAGYPRFQWRERRR